ncbi:MAG TPA: cell wall hydrolase [Rhizomicrobium sp.]|nr:cell wall hydrolase [Rhizomicrobium sp.]
MANLKLPQWPQEQQGTKAVDQNSAPHAASQKAGAGILGGWSPADWNLSVSGLNLIMEPKALADIDFQDAKGQSLSTGEGFYTGLSAYTPDPDAQRLFRRGLNGNGYVPQANDANLLARLIFAEGASTPQDMDRLGWAAVNRVGNREFGQTLERVLHQRNAFEPVYKNSHQWQLSADPQKLTGPNAAAWQRAQDTAQGILEGSIPDPIDGAAYFFHSRDYKGTPETALGDYKRMLGDNLIVPVYSQESSGTGNYFFKRNPYAK